MNVLLRTVPGHVDDIAQQTGTRPSPTNEIVGQEYFRHELVEAWKEHVGDHSPGHHRVYGDYPSHSSRINDSQYHQPQCRKPREEEEEGIDECNQFLSEH